MYSPIAIFAYNRYFHLEKLLNSLEDNDELSKSKIYIFCDGLRDDASEIDKESHTKVKNLIMLFSQKYNCTLIFAPTNLGLTKSIVGGVNFVLKENEKVIVLEDDLLLSKSFLKYMNTALDMYCENDKVGCIHGWNYSIPINLFRESSFFLKGADCWGWATWKKSWNLYIHDANYLLHKIKNINGFNKFLLPNYDLLKLVSEKKHNSWAIRWHASLYINNKYCLYPSKSLVTNTGLDSSGSNCLPQNYFQIINSNIVLKKIKAKESRIYLIHLLIFKIRNKIEKIKNIF